MDSHQIAARFARLNRGVTLLEMLVVMGIVGILLAIAIPSYQYVTNSNRIAGEGNALLGDLQFARAEAIKEGQWVSVCVSSNGTSCLTGATNTSWNNGWIVFSDTNGNGSVDVATDVVLRVQAPFTGSDTFTANNSISFVTFNREGFVAALATGALITLHASPTNNASTRCLNITRVGLMSIQTYGGTCT